MEKRKIIFFAECAGGVEEYLYLFLKRFNREKYEKYLVVSYKYKDYEEKFKSICKNIYFIDVEHEINPLKDIKAIIQFRKIIKKIKPDILYLHSSKAGGIGRLALWFNKKIRIVYNAHGWYFNAEISDIKKKIYVIIEKILAKRTDKIINISKDEYESAIYNKIASNEKMCLIYNGIDFEKFEDANKYRTVTRQKYRISEDDILIGIVGRISEQKDPISSIRSFKIVNESYPNTYIMFVGSGELEGQVKAYAEDYNINDKVIITGWDENVEKYIPAFDIAMLPSKWEGFGLAIIEYMACDKPIIASELGGIKDIIVDGKNGLLVKSNNQEDLSKKIIELIENKKLRNKLVNNNKEYKFKYNIDNVVEKHVEIFDNL